MLGIATRNIGETNGALFIYLFAINNKTDYDLNNSKHVFPSV